jgi:deoxyribonuclease V
MEYQKLHKWDLTTAEARALQLELAARVKQEPLDIESLNLVAGCDCSFEANPEVNPSPATAGFVLLDLPKLQPVEFAGARTTVAFPYIPGLFSFREIPPLLEAWSRLTRRPDAILCDGQGLAHPRRFGLACHLGVLLDIPTVGVAKTLLVGKSEPVPDEKGAWKPLLHKGDVVGAALRTRVGVTPVYVSIGHKVDLDSAIALALHCVKQVRLPETTRFAHNFVNDLRRDPETSTHQLFQDQALISTLSF